MTDDPRWTEVDRYFEDALLPPDPALDAALAANEAAGLPPHHVTPLQGRFLDLLLRSTGARRVLEIGTLGGYSTIWLARAVGEEGRVVTLEIDPARAELARGNLQRAGVADRVDLRVGPASETLARMTAEGEGPFDLIFIDADKASIPAYFALSVPLSRPGTLILTDNVVRRGEVVDPESTDPSIVGVRAFVELLADEPRVSATTIQTVGAKGHDGFTLALVKAI